MSDTYSKEELLRMGFESVGAGVIASRDARFFAIRGRLGARVRIDAFSIMTGNIILGNDVHISPFCFLGGTGGTIRMGNGSGLSTHVSVFTKSVDYSSPTLTDAPKLTGDVLVGEKSVVGHGSTLMPGTRIGKRVSIGCNSVVSGPILTGAIVVSRGMGLVTLSKRKGGGR